MASRKTLIQSARANALGILLLITNAWLGGFFAILAIGTTSIVSSGWFSGDITTVFRVACGIVALGCVVDGWAWFNAIKNS